MCSQAVLEELRVCVMFFAHLALDIADGESQMYPSGVREAVDSDHSVLGVFMQVRIHSAPCRLHTNN